MAKEREPLFCVAAGEKGSGKTWYTKNVLIDNYVRGSVDVPPRKVLIIDINNEYPYRTLQVVANENYNSIMLFNKQSIIEARKVSVFKNNGDRKTPNELKSDLSIILKHFKNGLIVIEDINKIMSDNVSSEIFGYLCVNRHSDQDLCINVQNIGRAGHPKIKSTMNILRLHHVKESAWRHESKFEDDTHIIRLGQLIVNNRFDLGIKKKVELENKGIFKGNKTYDMWDVLYTKFFVYINFDKDIITGNFSKEEFENAAYDYIYENEAYTITPLLKKRDRKSGKLSYNYTTAVDKCIQDLILKHYGNK